MNGKRKHPEADFQAAVYAYLTHALDGNSWFSAIPLGGGGTLRGALLKRTGTKAGLPDVAVVNDGRIIWLELKAKGGWVSDAQRACHEQLRRAKSRVYVCKTLEDVAAALNSAGIPAKARTVL